MSTIRRYRQVGRHRAPAAGRNIPPGRHRAARPRFRRAAFATVLIAFVLSGAGLGAERMWPA